MSSSRRPLSLRVSVDQFPYRAPFQISGHVFTSTGALLVELSDGQHTGRGEAAGVYFMGDDVDVMISAIERVRPQVEAGLSRAELQGLLPACGARNALDCALWDLDAKVLNTSVHRLAGLFDLHPLNTAITLGAEEPSKMADKAEGWGDAWRLKLKLTGEAGLDAERVGAVRAACPAAWIAVDANQGYTREGLPELLNMLMEHRVALLEQPLPQGSEAELDGIERPLPFAADESALCLADLDGLVGRFDLVNIKLDKCGGLTEGLAMAARARALGLGVMVGNMVGSSLAMAPAFVLGQLCDVVDLDGPLFLAEDRSPGVIYANGTVDCPVAFWGVRAKTSVPTPPDGVKAAHSSETDA